jgi:hypothetical protein
MKGLIKGDPETVEWLAERLKKARTHAEYQRIQCVLIRATLGSSAREIVQLLGWVGGDGARDPFTLARQIPCFPPETPAKTTASSLSISFNVVPLPLVSGRTCQRRFVHP